MDFVENHFDHYGGRSYRLFRCRVCAVVSTEPRTAVGADWYVKATPLRDRESRPPPESDWRFQQFLSDRLTPGRLLDVGCGDGGFLRLAAGHGFAPIGFDYDARVVAQAKARGLDACAMEFSDFIAGCKPGEFDFVTMFDVLEHTPEPAWFFGQVKRLIRPGGHVVITLPNALRPLPWGREEHDFPPHHFTRWTPDAMKDFLEREGFEVIRQEAGALKLRYLCDHFFFYRLMPNVLALARRVLFGKPAEGTGATLTELYDRAGGAKAGMLGDKMRRQKIINAARCSFQCLFAPVGLCLKTYYCSREPRSGDCLFTLARRKV